MIRLDAATVLLQWATGGLLFLWVTTRRREVGIGYGWLLRAVYAVLAVARWPPGRRSSPSPVRDACAGARRRGALAPRSRCRSCAARRASPGSGRGEARRVAAMIGATATSTTRDSDEPEFPPALDLVAPAIGAVGLVAAGLAAGGNDVLAVVRTLVGAAFLGAVTDAMLLGHWYLVQPGLGRGPLNELNRWVAYVWPFEVAALLWPAGMV